MGASDADHQKHKPLHNFTEASYHRHSHLPFVFVIESIVLFSFCSVLFVACIVALADSVQKHGCHLPRVWHDAHIFWLSCSPTRSHGKAIVFHCKPKLTPSKVLRWFANPTNYSQSNKGVTWIACAVLPRIENVTPASRTKVENCADKRIALEILFLFCPNLTCFACICLPAVMCKWKRHKHVDKIFATFSLTARLCH